MAQPEPASQDALARLLAEQSTHYDELAPAYRDGALDLPGADELEQAVHDLALPGDLLELACGPGVWTPILLRHARTITAVDSSPRMLALARNQVGADVERVRFLQADLFTWTPDRRYDHVFFGFWLSHVPPERFAAFWALVDDALTAGGTVTFVDDTHRSNDELIDGPDATTVQRALPDGRTHRVIKVPHTPAALARELAHLGWNITVHATAGPFYWGHGHRTDEQLAT